ncbi:asparagine synthetase B family protein [Rhizomicrobium electricum]|uniref:asparagine synthase (glutamine-hydrolyzing) n=1 Tax=Rhizomicrobium electricum TaxID=480070 RepID=A0ABP3QBY1_9PROT|nr:asparagine synthase-related protein [Rhizomicrobium electricum]NIJ50541.1 asparagine synthase (glutamine-hydrolysing) [Rhizomicrobium electricum]
MTAIFGLWHRNGRPDITADAARMSRSLAIYGPDRSGSWSSDDLVLGTDLFILTPEDRLDRQPVASRDGRLVLVADMRLDNRMELTADLGLTAENARTMADADFALAAWERWGEGALDRLIGDWALAVWDGRERTLTLARDFLGNRPLFYRADSDRLAFASMAKGIHALPGVPIAPDLDTLRDQLALAPMRGPGSHFAGINRVEPGALVIAHADGRIETRDWYTWRLDRKSRFARDDDAVEAFRATFDRAVADRLRSIGSIAAHLSGGLDSAAAVSSAARLLAGRGARLTAYTHVPMKGVVLDEPEGRIVDEGPLAALLAARYPNVDHVLVDSAGREIGDDFDRNFFYCERPVLNPCNALWVREIARKASNAGHRVVMSASCGNATISQDGVQRIAELFSSGRLAAWWREAAALRREGYQAQRVYGGLTLLPLLPARAAALLRALAGRERKDLAEVTALHPDVIAGADLNARLKDLDFDPTYRPWRNHRALAAFILRRHDRGTNLKGELGAFGVDRRDPTCDRRLVELTLEMPSHMYLRDGQTKWLYRQAFADRIPEETLAVNAKHRGYQGADWFARMQGDRGATLRMQAAMALAAPGVAGLIDCEGVKSLLERPLPAKPGTTTTRNYRTKLLRAISVAHFVAKATRSNGAGDC